MMEIDAKAKMKERMAAMRAKRTAKGSKAKAPAVTKPKKSDAVTREDTEYVGTTGAATANVSTTSEQIPKQKVWPIANMADITAIPEEHLSYFLHSMRIEVIKAIRAKKKISYFVFNERHALETHFKDEDVFE